MAFKDPKASVILPSSPITFSLSIQFHRNFHLPPQTSSFGDSFPSNFSKETRKDIHPTTTNCTYLWLCLNTFRLLLSWCKNLRLYKVASPLVCHWCHWLLPASMTQKNGTICGSCSSIGIQMMRCHLFWKISLASSSKLLHCYFYSFTAKPLKTVVYTHHLHFLSCHSNSDPLPQACIGPLSYYLFLPRWSLCTNSNNQFLVFINTDALCVGYQPSLEIPSFLGFWNTTLLIFFLPSDYS